MVTFPFLASDCNSFPLHSQLACNYTNSWYPYYSSQKKGNKRTKSGKWGGSFLRQFCYWWNGVFLSAPQLLSISCNHLLLNTFKPSCIFSCTDPAVFRLCSSCVGWRQPFLTGSFFKIDYWLCLQDNQPHVSLYKQSIFTWAKLCSCYITFPTLAKIYYASESNFRYVFTYIRGFTSANIFIRECSSSSLLSV